MRRRRVGDKDGHDLSHVHRRSENQCSELLDLGVNEEPQECPLRLRTSGRYRLGSKPWSQEPSDFRVCAAGPLKLKLLYAKSLQRLASAA